MNNDEWNNAAAQNLTNATITTQQHNESNNSNDQLENINDEIKMNNSDNSDYNAINNNYKDLISKMNTVIEKSISFTKRQKVFQVLFTHLAMGVYSNLYMATNSFVNILKTHFGSYKYNINNNELSLQSQLNLKCVTLIVNNSKTLQQAIESVICQEKEKEKEKSQLDADYLIKYFSNYTHKCDNNNENNELNFIIIDMLRNLLFQVGIVCQIIRYSAAVTNDSDVFSMLDRYLYLGLMDTTIENYGVSLYHVMAQHRRRDFLKLFLMYTDQNWSLMKDASGQV